MVKSEQREFIRCWEKGRDNTAERGYVNKIGEATVDRYPIAKM